MTGPIVICMVMAQLELRAAAGTRTELLGLPVAIAPVPGSQLLGEVSGAAMAFGIAPGMRIGEAFARCPRLRLVPGDPAGAQQQWDLVLVALESIGAAVEVMRPGTVCFEAQGLFALHRGGLDAVLAAAREAVGVPVRFGVAPTRFAAIAAAQNARARRPLVIAGGESETRRFLAPLAISTLAQLPALAPLVDDLERLGIITLGELAALSVAAVSDRFGRLGLGAYTLVNGGDRRLRPRARGEILQVELELPEAFGAAQLEHATGLLIDRLLADPRRRGRRLRALMLSAVLVEGGGTWQVRVNFREALGDPVRIRLALSTHICEVPAPARALRLSATELADPIGEQRSLLDGGSEASIRRLREAVRQVRAGVGDDGALRVVTIEPDSRLPERRALLAPFEC